MYLLLLSQFKYKSLRLIIIAKRPGLTAFLEKDEHVSLFASFYVSSLASIRKFQSGNNMLAVTHTHRSVCNERKGAPQYQSRCPIGQREHSAPSTACPAPVQVLSSQTHTHSHTHTRAHTHHFYQPPTPVPIIFSPFSQSSPPSGWN